MGEGLYFLPEQRRLNLHFVQFHIYATLCGLQRPRWTVFISFASRNNDWWRHLLLALRYELVSPLGGLGPEPDSTMTDLLQGGNCKFDSAIRSSPDSQI